MSPTANYRLRLRRARSRPAPPGAGAPRGTFTIDSPHTGLAGRTGTETVEPLKNTSYTNDLLIPPSEYSFASYAQSPMTAARNPILVFVTITIANMVAGIKRRSMSMRGYTESFTPALCPGNGRVDDELASREKRIDYRTYLSIVNLFGGSSGERWQPRRKQNSTPRPGSGAAAIDSGHATEDGLDRSRNDFRSGFENFGWFARRRI
ncbi:hypothetical protein EVAR_102970_1 [Eumeta japonica]|uniref:Uncharacterized protein n=1 Tax=Eumeta variegata TaxID=151549 RepID=A0A4C1UQT6_EUMVA|nr:hypothetical protein EVAR_102970_1 [Eumeta japonica]